MITVESYTLAVILFVFCMICWGSWANTQKLLEKNWRFELFYWDLVIGLVLMSFLGAITLGSLGETGRAFFPDLFQAETKNLLYAFLGGVVWNLGNLLLVAAISIAGLAVAFPIGGGLAWVVGIIFNYVLEVINNGEASSNPLLLWSGVLVVVVAIYSSGEAYKRQGGQSKKPKKKGIILSVIAGLLIAFFYGLVVNSLDSQFVSGGQGNLMPLTAVFIFSLGAFISTFVFNTYFMKKPVNGEPVSFSDYFNGTAKNHLIGILGGIIWMLGMVLSFLAVGAGSPAISYALSNSAPLVAAFWGVFIWKEFEDAPKSAIRYISIMFICYIIGLALIIMART